MPSTTGVLLISWSFGPDRIDGSAPGFEASSAPKAKEAEEGCAKAAGAGGQQQ
jgi:hypothetical protein